MIIGLDFDGVIVKSNKLKSGIAENKYGVIVRATYFGRDYVVNQLGDLSHEQYDAILDEIYTNPEHIKRVEFIDGALENIRKLLREGEEIRIVTSRRAENDITRKILEQQGLDLDVRNVGPESTKVEACKGCVVFVDDDLKKLIQLLVDNKVLSISPQEGGNSMEISIPNLTGVQEIIGGKVENINNGT